MYGTMGTQYLYELQEYQRVKDSMRGIPDSELEALVTKFKPIVDGREKIGDKIMFSGVGVQLLGLSSMGLATNLAEQHPKIASYLFGLGLAGLALGFASSYIGISIGEGIGKTKQEKYGCIAAGSLLDERKRNAKAN